MPEPEDTGPPGPVVGLVGTGRLAGAVRQRARAEGLPVTEYAPRQPEHWSRVPAPQVLVDCSDPAVTYRVLELSANLRVPLVTCVSNLEPGHLDRIAELARDVAVVRATNLSLGSYLQDRAVDQLAQLLQGLARAGLPGALPEAAVLERHPVTKAHRPSATAMALGERWRRLTGNPPSDIASLRAGPPVSDHEIRLSWPGYALTIRHEVHSFEAAATGALAVARWVVGRRPGRYAVADVFDELGTSPHPNLSTTTARTE